MANFSARFSFCYRAILAFMYAVCWRHVIYLYAGKPSQSVYEEDLLPSVLALYGYK